MSWVILAALGFVAGAAAGLVFFGGLWWTTHRLSTASRPGLLLSVSLLGRLVVLAVVFVTLASLDPVLLVGAVPGLLAARSVLTRPGMIDRLPTRASSTSGPSGEA